MAACITGLGAASPTHAVSQARSAEMASTVCNHPPRLRRLLPQLYRRSGVQHRGSVLLTEAAEPDGNLKQAFFTQATHEERLGPTTEERMKRYEAEVVPLAARAAIEALADAHCAPDHVTHLVTVSCTGFVAPGPDIGLIKRLGLPASVQRTHVGFMGCHGAFNALRVAHGLIAADPEAVVLVCAFELCSLHFRYTDDPQQIVANALFADGAAAAVCRSALSNRSNQRAKRNGDDHDAWTLSAFGSHVLPDTESAMTWRITDHGFAMTLSPQLPDIIRQHLCARIEPWLADRGLRVADVASWAIHPGGQRILEAAADALGIDRRHVDDSRIVLAKHGNMSSPTILFILDRLRRRGAARPAVALGFGPGLTIEATLFR